MRDGISWVAFDSNGEPYFLGTFTGTRIEIVRYYSGNWTFGGPIGLSMLQSWSSALYKNQKYLKEQRYITSFLKGGKGGWDSKIHRRFVYKSYRMKIRGHMSKDAWDMLFACERKCAWKTY